jgi:hypothetical protein
MNACHGLLQDLVFKEDAVFFARLEEVLKAGFGPSSVKFFDVLVGPKC